LRVSEESEPLWTSRAFGKVILLGEHAVVFGEPALAVAIDREARGRATPLSYGPSKLFLHGWSVLASDDDAEQELGRALRAIVEASGIRHPVYVEATSGLAPASGLGCSAALGVTVARAIDPMADDATIISRTMAWERVFHGEASGVDAAVAATGACILFRKGNAPEDVSIAGRLSLCVGLSGVASSTKVMVSAVAALRRSRAEAVDLMFRRIGELVANGRVAIEYGNLDELGRLMDANQRYLEALGVSTPAIDELCAVARAAGALGVKLTGGGGGGSVVALAQDDAAAMRVIEAWRQKGFVGFVTHIAPTAHQRLLRAAAPERFCG
jgi:mevalonate kinase